MRLSRAARVEKLIERINSELDADEYAIFWYGGTPERRVVEAERLVEKAFPTIYRQFPEFRSAAVESNPIPYLACLQKETFATVVLCWDAQTTGGVSIEEESKEVEEHRTHANN